MFYCLRKINVVRRFNKLYMRIINNGNDNNIINCNIIANLREIPSIRYQVHIMNDIAYSAYRIKNTYSPTYALSNAGRREG